MKKISLFCQRKTNSNLVQNASIESEFEKICMYVDVNCSRDVEKSNFWKITNLWFKVWWKKTVWTAPTKCDVTPQTNKENKFTKDYLSNQYSIEPNSPATDLNFFCQMWFVPWKRLKKENSTWQKSYS
jgi:hypothetical protein